MSGHPQRHYDDGYGHQPQGTDSYYQDENGQGYYDQQHDYANGLPGEYGHGQQGNGGYYDEA